MNDREQIVNLYHDMYEAMVSKDEAELDRIHDSSFILIHMTGMRQNKQEYIRAIMNGTLNYYAEQTESMEIQIAGDTAILSGHSKVTAAVFGGGKNTWRLALQLDIRKTNGTWKIARAQASTW